jgi:ABC-type polysaccharide/polyol phosphate export permease
VLTEQEAQAAPAGMSVNLLVQDIKEMIAEQFQYRELLIQMTKRDLLLRYKQTIMGVGWAIFMPLVNTAVFSVIFTRVAPLDTPVPYPLFAYCGLLTWNFSAATFRASVGSLTSNAGLVSKIYFPREIFPLSALAVSVVDLAVGSSVLLGLMLWYRVPPSAEIALLPAVILVHVMFNAAVALLLAVANLFYRDVKYLFEVVITVWMFATAVLYPIEVVEGKLGMILQLNPMTHIIDAYRAAILGVNGNWLPFLGTAFGSLVLLLGSWLLFHRSEFEFAERI